ncbi:sugar ABC transporter ATP-binding protein [Enterococcus quebecensis]|uniref:D-xylose ABC transporter ATP-binding protein n=1 Tax=Enterococcus quebecensis TaxID=903983 RepID=A0A1E5GSP3_9ENTE|nr:sugar ABC transporter ATP-binding protein [Enterococcus quebecensis]OEG15645.1 D-xylose ABC transporter ATP-binding protein [Enterococcus quebecensis]OJG74569.1 D-ribose transporter ATP binding protein [Enterococcus quebecensis]
MEVKMTGINKSFGTNKVLEGVDFELKSGEIHALMGENGAGKSTLMNILTGLHKKDAGKIYIDGKETYFKNPKEAEEFGLTFIHQEMNTFSEMTVLENMYLNREIKTTFGLLDTNKMAEKAKAIFDELHISLDLHEQVGRLSVGQQQMLEIAKSLMLNGQVLIMDEPTAALSEMEIANLFTIIRGLKEKGVAIVYISHRMEEIFALCDRITVMRDGVSVSCYQVSDVDVNQIVRDMVGRDIGDFYPEKTTPIGSVKFEVKNLTSKQVFNDVSFSVREGEILGFSGLMGSGRTEIMRAIFGIDSHDSGEILLKGEKLTIRKPSDAIKQGIGFLTEDRKEEGLILDFSLEDNIVLPSVDEFAKHGLLEKKTMDEFVELLLKRLTVKAESKEVPASSLSGGNQQKVVLAKWIGIGPQVLILDEPTRGVDVGAKREIYLLMNELAERGVAIIMISSDLPEVMSVSDRVIVVREGQIAGEVSKEEATQEKIMNLATGGN